MDVEKAISITRLAPFTTKLPQTPYCLSPNIPLIKIINYKMCIVDAAELSPKISAATLASVANARNRPTHNSLLQFSLRTWSKLWRTAQ